MSADVHHKARGAHPAYPARFPVSDGLVPWDAPAPDYVPVDFLHPPGHPHWVRPDFQGCRHCAPPVQGRVVLLYAKRDGSGRLIY